MREEEILTELENLRERPPNSEVWLAVKLAGIARRYRTIEDTAREYTARIRDVYRELSSKVESSRPTLYHFLGLTPELT